MLTGRAENHIRGVDDLDDTIARLLAYRDAGADACTRRASPTSTGSRRVVDAVGAPVNVLALASGPPIGELERVGVRRVSTGGSSPAPRTAHSWPVRASSSATARPATPRPTRPAMRWPPRSGRVSRV